MNETLTRTLSGVVYIVLLIAASLRLNSFLLLFGLFLLVMVVEFCDLVQLKKFPALAISVFGYVLFAYFTVNKNTELLLLAATLFVAVKSFIFLIDPLKNKMDTLSKYVFLIGYVILPVILITKIPSVQSSFNPKIIIGIFILIWTNDTFAFIIGKSIGKRKLFERISPKKTIEGFFGGLIFAVVFAILVAKYYVYHAVYQWVVISLILSVFGTIGDLVESKFKRMALVKDSGKIMPGHGGILDRLDSVIFAAPFVFLFYQILYYVS
ncbi:MAG: CDP-archaeol synthase [Burkholderiales bacterium]|nr:CDP-archaeol synthase [Flavobacterium sp.]